MDVIERHGGAQPVLQQVGLGADFELVGRFRNEGVVAIRILGAGAFAEALRHGQGHLKVIAVIGDGEEPGTPFPGANAERVMLSDVDETSEIEWLETIEDVFFP